MVEIHALEPWRAGAAKHLLRTPPPCDAGTRCYTSGGQTHGRLAHRAACSISPLAKPGSIPDTDDGAVRSPDSGQPALRANSSRRTAANSAVIH
jgi:hypothetical protein